MSQQYGALRIVRLHPPAGVMADFQEKYPTGWLPEAPLVHVLTRRETTIGRALCNDVILLDPTVSREHARLVLDECGWRLVNLTPQNAVRVNGRPVSGGGSVAVQPQDVLVLGSTMLQLIAPQSSSPDTLTYAETPTQRLAPLVAPPPESLPSGGSVAQNGHHMNSPERRGTASLPEYVNFDSSQVPAWQQRVTPPAIQKVLPGIVPAISNLAPPPEIEAVEQPWEEERGILGASVTMQFVLPQRMGARTRWLIVGGGITLLVVSAIITVVLNGLIGLSALAQNGPSSIIAALTIPVLPALGIMLLVDFMDRFEREPWFLRLAAFLWGAIIAIPPALLIETNVSAFLQNFLGTDALVRSLFQGLNAGITEETVKGIGLLLLFVVLRDEFDNVTDGIVYGALIGAGFAMVENFVYFARNSKDFLLFLIVGRVLLGWLCHSTFTVCFGAALGYVRHTRVRWRQIVIPLLGYIIAVGLHSVFDFVDFFANAIVLNSPGNASVALFSLLAVIGDYIPPFIAQIALVYLLIRSLAHEAAVIREFLASEVSSGVVRVEEYALLQNSFLRVKEERRVLWSQGFRQWQRVQSLYQTQIGLAFRKWHVSMGDKPKLGYRQPEDAYRQRIKQLRKEIAQADMERKSSPGRA
jgi:RsiW-degrading membrane proteinase PrsW (M82 family)